MSKRPRRNHAPAFKAIRLDDIKKSYGISSPIIPNQKVHIDRPNQLFLQNILSHTAAGGKTGVHIGVHRRNLVSILVSKGGTSQYASI